MPVQRLKPIGSRPSSRFLRNVRNTLARFLRTVQQWKYPAQLRTSFLEWIQEIFLWLRTPDRAKRRSSGLSNRVQPLSLVRLSPLSFQKIRRFPRPPQPVRLAAFALLLIVGPLVLGSILFPSGSRAAWYNSSWSNRKEITIDHTKVSGSSNLTDFPMLVSITDTALQTKAQSDGDDILFTASDGTTKLDHEIESYNSSTGTLVAWVKIPTLSYSADTEIYMYYGNSGASSQQNVNSTWKSAYKAVWHLKEDPSGSAPQIQDSTSGEFHGTTFGSMASGAQVAGQINGSITFDGSNDYINTGNLGITSGVVTFWMKPGNSGSDSRIFSQASGSTGQGGAVRYNSGALDVWNGSSWLTIVNASTLSSGNWYHIAILYSGSQATAYVNGVQKNTVNTGFAFSGPNFSIANRFVGSFGNYYNGVFDEFRVSDTSITADWIITEYNNQNSPGTFLSVGSEESDTSDSEGEGDWYSLSWGYRRSIPISHAGSSVTEYQVLVDNLDTASLISAGKLQADCDDIRFTADDGTTEIPYSIVTKSCNTSDTEIWVKVPSITSAGTSIYMYYGNGAASAGQNESATFSYSSEKTVAYVVSDAFSAVSVISIEDGNSVTHNGNTQALDRGDSYSFTTSNFGAVNATKLAQIGGPASENDIAVPVSWAGTEFLMMTRQGTDTLTDTFHVKSPWGSSTVRIYSNGTEQTGCGSPWTVTSSGTTITCNVASQASVRITASIPVLVFYDGDPQDAMALYPATTEPLFGLSGRQLGIVAGPSGADYRILLSSDSSETNPSDLGANGGDRIVDSTPAYGEHKPVRTYSTNYPIGVKNWADGDGSEATTHINHREFGTKFGSSLQADYLAFFSDQNATCSVYNVGSGTPIETETLTTNNSIPAVYGHPNLNDFGTGSSSTYTTGAWLAECDKPAGLIFQDSNTNGERNTWSYPMMRQYTYPAPAVGTLSSEEEKPSGEDGDWYNTDWAYRREITVTNNVSTESSVYISFDGAHLLDTSAAGKFQGDCGDIRFTTANGTLLNYAINSGCGTSSTDIDVFFLSFPAGTQSIYMYYGNSGAADGFSSPTLGSPTTSYITSGSTWNVPTDWNSSANTIEAIGAGGSGGLSVSNSSSGGGGGGGEYRRAENVTLTPGSTVNINIPGGGAGSSATGTRLQNNSNTTVVEAKNGGNASGTSAGAGGTGGTGAAANFAGGNGGAGVSNNIASGGGGGSAGPSGVGRNGAAGAGGTSQAAGGGGGSNGGSSTNGSTNSGQTGGAGGHGNSGSGGGAGGTNNSNNAGNGTNGGGGGGSGTAGSTNGGKGGDGAAENLWGTGIGPSGGGGGGGGANGTGASGDKDGGNGGAYGGGAGGCGISGTMQAGECDGSATAGQGLLVITYTPLTSPFSTEATDYTIGTIGAEEMPGTSSPAPGTNELGTAGSNPNANLLFSWGLDEQQGQTTNSRVAGGPSGTLGANSSASTDDPTWKTQNDCKVNGCLSFDGGDYVKTANNALDTLSTAATYTLWFKTSSTGESLLFSNEGYHGVYMNFLGQSGKLTAFFDGSSGGHTATSLTYNDNAWHHLAATNDGSTTRLYIDGNKVMEFSETFAQASSTQPFVLGAQYTGATSRFTGSIDELRVYNTALTHDQIRIDMNAGSAVNFSTSYSEAALMNDGAGAPPVGHWLFDDNTGSSTVDSSGNNYTGTISGGVWTNNCKSGSCLYFDGSSSVALSGPSLSTDGTIAGWFYWTAGNASLLRDNTCGTGWILGYNSSGNLAFRAGGSTYSTGVAVSGLQNRWTHYTLTKSGSSVAYYIDGQLIYTDTGAGNTAATMPWQVIKNGSCSGQYATGSVDEIKIYDYARTPAQVAYDYNRGGPVAWWKFDECSGTTAYDSSGQGFNGTITIGASGTYTSAGSCSSGTATEAWNAGTTGKINSALGLDGTNDSISVSNATALNPGNDFTLTGWIKPDAQGGHQVIIDKLNYAGNTGYQLKMEDSGSVTNGLSLCIGNTCVVSASNIITDAVWQHIAVVFDTAANTATFYVNGQARSSVTQSNNLTTNTNSLYLGAEGGSAFRFDGLLDDMRIYSYALSAAQIRQLMNQGTAFFGPATGSQ
jgi:hypothetical protein